MSGIHSSAVVDPAAEVDPSVEIGPHCVVGAGVRLAEGVVLRPNSIVSGDTQIGARTEIFPFACIGEVPQDIKFRGEQTQLVIGARNQIREHVTIHPGTADSGGITTVGDDNLLMVGMHIGHDCQVGSHTVIANNVLLAGHVLVEDWAWISGASAVLQFCRVGESAFISGMSGLMRDLAPYCWSQGYPARVLRVNKLSLERRGFSKERIEPIERAFRILFRSGQPPRESFAQIREELKDSAEAEQMVAFLEKSERGFARLR